MAYNTLKEINQEQR